jgi:hypothetical protein
VVALDAFLVAPDDPFLVAPVALLVAPVAFLVEPVAFLAAAGAWFDTVVRSPVGVATAGALLAPA